MNNPKVVLLFSGKRKSGKDFLAERVLHRLGAEYAVIVRLAAPIKSHWATTKGLKFDDLLSDSDYKERYRMEMVKWGEEKRFEDGGYFCRAAIEMSNANVKPVWIVSDARRVSDLEWFQTHYKNVVVTVRIAANDDVRKTRGWVFTPGVDDAETECGLDAVSNWDWIIENNGSDNHLDGKINDILNHVKSKISS